VESYDSSINQVNFLMLDGLPNGTYQLHLSGALGLSDWAGNSLAGNDPSGDYVIHFTVNGSVRGTGDNRLLWLHQVADNDDEGSPQALGPLFPKELTTGVAVTRDFRKDPVIKASDTGDYYQIQVLQSQAYTFNLLGSGLPAGASVKIFDTNGKELRTSRQRNVVQINLKPGTYVVYIGSWTPSRVQNANYQILIKAVGAPDNPTALTVGPAPLIGIRLDTNTLAPPSQPPSSGDNSPPARPCSQRVATPRPPSSPETTNPLTPPASSQGTTTPSATPSPSPGNDRTPTSPPPPQEPINTVTTPSPSQGTTPTPESPSVPSGGTQATGTLPTPVGRGATATPQTGANVATNSSSITRATSTTTFSPPQVVLSNVPAGPAVPAVSSEAPVSSSLSVALVVSLVAPSGVNNAGTTQAVVRGNTDRPADSVRVPSGVLLALGTGPVGGVKEAGAGETPSSGNRATILAGNVPAFQDQQPRVVLASVVQSGANINNSLPDPLVPKSVDAPRPLSRSQKTVLDVLHDIQDRSTQMVMTLAKKYLPGLLSKPYVQVLDAFFGMKDWFEQPALVPSPIEATGEESLLQLNVGDEEDFEATLPRNRQDPAVGDPWWINGLVAAGAVAAVHSKKRKNVRSAVRLRREKGGETGSSDGQRGRK
jgi:hypothetical protein